MKKYLYLLCSLVILLSACQQEQDFSNGNIGYLRLDLGVNTSAISRAETPYNPKQIAVQIIAKDGEVVKETNDWTEWESQQIALPVGMYTLKASSAGFDGKTSGFDKPYYAGSAEVNIEKDKEVNETVICTLANVKVTVNFDQSFIDAFKEAKVTVDDNADNEGIESLDFIMGQENKSAYFPVTTLKAVVNVVNKQDVTNSQTNIIENVQARDHYILNYKVGEVTGGDVSVSIDPTTRTYTYNVTISTQPKTTLTLSSANAWAKFAYLEGTAVTTESLESTKMVMEYRQKNTEDWTPLVTTVEEGTYKAKVEGLTPATQYECRMVYGEEEYISSVTEFTTETIEALPNSNFDNWWRQEEKDNSPWYAIASEDATAFDTDRMLFSFWDSGNGGTAPLMKKNPTAPEGTEVHTEEGKSVKMQSQFVGFLSLGKFAAGNIYTGHFCSANTATYQAKINFGQPFASRPVQMKGWFKYNRGTDVNYPKEGGEYKILLQQAGGDLCGIYIALVDNEGFDYQGHKYAYEVNGDLSADEPASFKYKNAIDFSTNNPNVIAYGSITEEEAKGTGEWQEFTIDLKYRDLTRKPKYIIVVASASKYGDYFTGSTGSLMYVDDFELIYDGEPSLHE